MSTQKTFRLMWKDGRAQRIKGENITAAFLAAGFTPADLPNLKSTGEVSAPVVVGRTQEGTIFPGPKSSVSVLSDVVGLFADSNFSAEEHPIALEAVMAEWEHFDMFCTKVADSSGKELFVICDRDASEETLKSVEDLANGLSIPTKGDCSLREAAKGVSPTSFWWDLEHRWMACFGQENAELVRYAIQQEVDDINTVEEAVNINPVKVEQSIGKMAAFG